MTKTDKSMILLVHSKGNQTAAFTLGNRALSMAELEILTEASLKSDPSVRYELVEVKSWDFVLGETLAKGCPSEQN